MAFDGVTISALTDQLKKEFLGGRIQKISQPECDEIMLLIKGFNGNSRLVMSANPSLPLIYITQENKTSPIKAPNFLMVLRKHLAGGKIVKIEQPSFERCIRFEVEHYDEMGDLKTNTLLIELMGKYSNIILVNSEEYIIDAIKRIPNHVSSLREVIPGRTYFIPDTMNKKNPITTTRDEFEKEISSGIDNIQKWLVNTFSGISPQIAREIIYRANVDDRKTIQDLTDIEKEKIKGEFLKLCSDVKNCNYQFFIYEKDEKPIEYSVIELKQYGLINKEEFSDVSKLISSYYSKKALYTRIHQKSTDLRQIVSQALERVSKKYNIQMSQEKSTQGREKYKIYGELLQAYGYSAKKGDDKIEVENYYDNNNKLIIPLDVQKTPQENANHYFKRYNKLKRTQEAVKIQIAETKVEVSRLESIKESLEIAENEEDLKDIKEELIQAGYIKRKNIKEKKKKTNQPLHFMTKDDFHIYVGKNNLQNDYLTNTFASKNDIWFHTKKFHGSHVILKNDGREIPDNLYEICASIAAYYSGGRNQNKVEVDYVKCKELHKVKGGAPGFVIYHTNYSITVKPIVSEELLKKV